MAQKSSLIIRDWYQIWFSVTDATEIEVEYDELTAQIEDTVHGTIEQKTIDAKMALLDARFKEITGEDIE